jgi:hypothetical protein
MAEAVLLSNSAKLVRNSRKTMIFKMRSRISASITGGRGRDSAELMMGRLMKNENKIK